MLTLAEPQATRLQEDGARQLLPGEHLVKVIPLMQFGIRAARLAPFRQWRQGPAHEGPAHRLFTEEPWRSVWKDGYSAVCKAAIGSGVRITRIFIGDLEPAYPPGHPDRSTWKGWYVESLVQKLLRATGETVIIVTPQQARAAGLILPNADYNTYDTWGAIVTHYSSGRRVLNRDFWGGCQEDGPSYSGPDVFTGIQEFVGGYLDLADSSGTPIIRRRLSFT